MSDLYTWDELRALSLARQFPDVGDSAPTVATVVGLATAIGPLQTQTARSAYLGLIARAPRLRRETITEAYESGRIVRGSTLRGTVHTTTPQLHPLTDAVTRVAQLALWKRALPLKDHTVDELWEEIERATTDRWLNTDQLGKVVAGWLASVEPEVQARWPSPAAMRYFTFGHGGLIRRPAKPGGSWSGQTAPVYRVLDSVLPEIAEHRRAVLADPQRARDELVENHLRWYGPATRHDVAWWSGLGLRQVDAALAELAPRLTTRGGPDGRDFHDLVGSADPVQRDGIDLLPEFDAVFCGYDPKARDRFVRPEHAELLWGATNGLTLSPLMRDGRIVGWWRTDGSGAKRDVRIAILEGRTPARRRFDRPLEGVAEALGVSIRRVEIERA